MSDYVYYTAKPHKITRNHQIPTKALKQLTGSEDRAVLDKKYCSGEIKCFLDILIIRDDDIRYDFKNVELLPTSGGEICITGKTEVDFPEDISKDDTYLVRIEIRSNNE